MPDRLSLNKEEWLFHSETDMKTKLYRQYQGSTMLALYNLLSIYQNRGTYRKDQQGQDCQKLHYKRERERE